MVEGGERYRYKIKGIFCGSKYVGLLKESSNSFYYGNALFLRAVRLWRCIVKQENDLIESPSIVVEGYNDIAGKLTN